MAKPNFYAAALDAINAFHWYDNTTEGIGQSGKAFPNAAGKQWKPEMRDLAIFAMRLAITPDNKFNVPVGMTADEYRAVLLTAQASSYVVRITGLNGSKYLLPRAGKWTASWFADYSEKVSRAGETFAKIIIDHLRGQDDRGPEHDTNPFLGLPKNGRSQEQDTNMAVHIARLTQFCPRVLADPRLEIPADAANESAKANRSLHRSGPILPMTSNVSVAELKVALFQSAMAYVLHRYNKVTDYDNGIVKELASLDVNSREYLSLSQATTALRAGLEDAQKSAESKAHTLENFSNILDRVLKDAACAYNDGDQEDTSLLSSPSWLAIKAEFASLKKTLTKEVSKEDLDVLQADWPTFNFVNCEASKKLDKEPTNLMHWVLAPFSWGYETCAHYSASTYNYFKEKLGIAAPNEIEAPKAGASSAA